ncbi:mercuric reductase [Rhizobiaceae bacterium]|nr:mercuric reductase [Rhizobiaceae bacterium]
MKAPSPQSLRESYEAQLEAQVAPSGWVNPTPADRYNLVVLGGGPAGLVSAKIAAGMGARVALVERARLGGDCLNIGCVPTKTLIRTARLYADMADATDLGAPPQKPTQRDFHRTMAQLARVRVQAARKDSADALTRDGIDVFFGDACFDGPDTLLVGDTRLRFKRAIVATGGRQRLPDIPGIDEAGYLTIGGFLDLTDLPSRLLIIGGGPLGTELAQALSRLGAQVHLIHSEPKFLPREERDAAQLLADALIDDGVSTYLDSFVTAVRRDGAETVVTVRTGHGEQEIRTDRVLTGIGRQPNVDGLGLEAAGVSYDEKDGIEVDDHLRTSNKRIFAAGDVCMPWRFTHVAEHSARTATINAMVHPFRRASRMVVPWCTYTDPEVAHVGQYVADANAAGVPTKTYTVMMHEVDRALTEGQSSGFVKVHVRLGTDTIVGATIVARGAGEMLNEITLAMQSGIGLRQLADVIHCYPTRSAAIAAAATQCQADFATRRWGRLADRWMAWHRR